MAAFLDSDSSDGEEFEGFVVSPEEKASYKVWTRKRRASDVFDGNSDSEENMSEDDDDDDDDDDIDDEDGDDYESAEGEEEEHEDEENDELDEALDDIHLQNSGDETSSGNNDQCPVCLMSLKEQLLGTPNNCPHVFCFECIQEWAKNATTCPVGRQPFSEILVHATRKGPILQRIPVEERKASDDEVEEDPTYCEVCGDFDREDRMLLCDGCDHGYHMECLTPPVQYVPVEEWFCPACSSQTESHQDRARLPGEEHGDSLGLMEVPRGRSTRGRPRGSTAARRVSVLGRTDTTRRARTVASTRGRGRTRRGRGRARGRGGRGSSTRRRTSSTTTGRKKRRRKRRSRSKKKTGTSSTKRRKKITKTKTLKPLKRRRVMIAEEDEVSPFIYEPQRRGRTVHARLLESLNSPGPTVEPGRSASLGRMPFPSRVEPSASFSLFGNTYALHDFADKEGDSQETSQIEDKTTAWSSESTDSDVLGSIFQGLDSLHTPSAQVARDGKILATADQSRAKGSSSSDAKGSKDTLTVNEDETKLKTDVGIIQRNAEEGKCLAESDKTSKEPDIAKLPSKAGKRNSDEECSPGNIFEKLSSSKTTVSCSKLSDTRWPQNTSSPALTSFKSSSSSPSNSLSSKSTLSGFRIPKRSSKSQDEPNPTSPSFSSASINVKQEPSMNSSISNFKIPKRTKSMSCDDSTKSESSSADITKPTNVKCIGQKLTTSSTSGVEQKLLFSNFTSPSKSITDSSCATNSAGSSLSYLHNSVRPLMQENLQRKNALNSSTTASVTNSSSVTGCHTTSSYTTAGPCVTNSSSVTRCIAKNVSGDTRSHTTTANTTAPCVTNSSSSTSCHATKVSDIPRSHTRTSNALTPLTKVAPVIDHLKPAGGKEQRRSNIEIIKLLHEKKRCMREEMSGDGKRSSSSRPGHSGVTDSSALPRKGIHVSDKSPTCSRPGHSGVTDSSVLPRKGIHVSDKSPTCSRPGHSGVTDPAALPRKGIHVSDKSPTCSRQGHSGVTDANALPWQGSHVSNKSPTCSRGIALPVAIVKPSPQIPSVVVNEPSFPPCNSLENSPVKSIASGIITAHSHNTREFRIVRSESDPLKTVGLNPSGPGHESETRKHDGMVTGANGDRDQQRKLGIVRLQRHEQIVDEVKLALKPFFKHGEITKDDYKLIMRKSVEKIKESSSSVDRDRVCRLVKKYIKKIKGVSP